MNTTRRDRLINQAMLTGLQRHDAEIVTAEALRIEQQGGVVWYGGQEQRRWAENTVNALCQMANMSRPTASELASQLGL